MENAQTAAPVECLVRLSFCDMAFDHQPNETCQHCGLEVDKYGNTEADFRNCCFPDCGCDGHRCCDAPSGANQNAFGCNVESMWQRTDKTARKAKMDLLAICSDGIRGYRGTDGMTAIGRK